MTAPGFTAHGKQVLALGAHYADAADTKAAEFIAEACEAKAKGGWQAIETATVSPIESYDVFTSLEERVTDARWNSARQYWEHWSIGGFDTMEWVKVDGRVTHLMPLPSAPVKA